MKIETRHIGKRVNGQWILHDVSLKISEGGIFILMGPNGAGKTTLLKLLAMLDTPSVGTVLADDRLLARLSSLEKTALRRRMGFVFQHPLLWNGTVKENLTYGLKLRKLPQRKEEIREMIEAVGLEEKENVDVHKLSGGEKQRLQLARALIFDPEVLMVDEPTANLDPLSSRFIEERLQSLARSGRTIVMTTHDMLQAHLLGHHVVFIDCGRIVQQGSVEEIRTMPATIDVACFSRITNILYGQMVQQGNETFVAIGDSRIQVAMPLTPGRVAAVIRPEDLLVSRSAFESSARNRFCGKVKVIEDLGLMVVIKVACADFALQTLITRQSLDQMNIRIDDSLHLTFKVTAVQVLPADRPN